MVAPRPGGSGNRTVTGTTVEQPASNKAIMAYFIWQVLPRLNCVREQMAQEFDTDHCI